MTTMGTTSRKTKRVLKRHIREKLCFVFFVCGMLLGAADSDHFGAFIVSKILAFACLGVAGHFAPEEFR